MKSLTFVLLAVLAFLAISSVHASGIESMVCQLLCYIYWKCVEQTELEVLTLEGITDLDIFANGLCLIITYNEYLYTFES